MSAIAAPLTVGDLRHLTNEMLDTMQRLISECEDADVVFMPQIVAADGAEVDVPWTLGHVIVHATASAEEAAFLGAELARGIEFHGRSRYEEPWEGFTTIAQCRARLEESRRMRLASLDMWPSEPHLEVKRPMEFLNDELDARGMFILGLFHDNSHLGQIEEIVSQARAAR